MFTGQGPEPAVDRHGVVPGEPVVFHRAAEVAFGFPVPAQDAQGVEGAVGAFVLDYEELS